ncbi:hypothetical protein [Flavisericum labens]
MAPLTLVLALLVLRHFETNSLVPESLSDELEFVSPSLEKRG